MLRPGDRVIAIAERENMEALRRLFVQRSGGG